MVSYYLKKIWKKKDASSWLKKVAHELISRKFRLLFCLPPQKLQRLQLLKCRTTSWAQERSFRIASTVVRRACSLNYRPSGNIISIYPKNDVGLCVENTITTFFKNHLRITGLHVHPDYQWLCTTPDGHHLAWDIPIEIKYNKSCVVIKKVIARNYHQLQFQMFCTGKRKLLMLVYDGTLTAITIDRDDHFIRHCLYKLRISITDILSSYKHSCRRDCKFVSDLIKLPHKKANKSAYRIQRKYAYKIINLNYAFPGTTIAKHNSLLAHLRSSIWQYEHIVAKRRASCINN